MENYQHDTTCGACTQGNHAACHPYVELFGPPKPCQCPICTSRMVSRPPIVVRQHDLDRMRAWAIANGMADSAATFKRLLDIAEGVSSSGRSMTGVGTRLMETRTR